MPNIFLQDGKFWLKLLLCRFHCVQLIMEHMDLCMLLDALEHDLFELLIALFDQARIKYRFLDMGMRC
jgi:hypothetical protein